MGSFRASNNIVALGMVTLIWLAVAVSAAYHATVTTVMMTEVENDAGESHCQQEIEKYELRSCHDYLQDSSRFEPGGNGWREAFPRCCEELEQLNEDCRCQGIKKVAEKQLQGGGGRGLEGREAEEMLQTAEFLPGLCRISPEHCDIHVGGRSTRVAF